MEGMTSFKAFEGGRAQFVSKWPYGIAGLGLVGYDSPVSMSFESAHFPPFFPLPQERLNFKSLTLPALF